MRTTVGEFIINRLKELGIKHIIGVPGDFNLSFIEQINEADDIEFVGACNELNAAYAADGYGRQSGVGALLTTYGVGELSALNGIAGARAEHVPMVSLAGSPPLYSTEYRWNLHHSLADGDFENMLESILRSEERRVGKECRAWWQRECEKYEREECGVDGGGGILVLVFFLQAEDGIRDRNVTGVQTCALPISRSMASLVHARSTFPW